MQTAELIRAYHGAGPGFIFRLRLRSPYQALDHRLKHGPASNIEPNGHKPLWGTVEPGR